MNGFYLQRAAAARLENIYLYTLKRFGKQQADKYLDGLFGLFNDIAEERITWAPIPVEFGVDGYFARFEQHFVFWKMRPEGHIAIVSILHRRMDVAKRLQEDTHEP